MNNSLSLDEKVTTNLLTKVPEITLLFWIAKLLTTAMGEVFSDFLIRVVPPPIALVIEAVGFSVALVIQFKARRYVAWKYWLAIAMVSVFGTIFADIMHSIVGIPLATLTGTYIVLLIVNFVAWYISEKTLSIHSINTKHREIFYWATVLIAFALGTAAGDFSAETLQLGYITSGIVYLVLFILPFICQKFLGLNEIFTFWFAYVMTRPLGASFADWVSVPADKGGLNIDRGVVTLVLTIFIVIAVVFLSKQTNHSVKKNFELVS